MMQYLPVNILGLIIHSSAFKLDSIGWTNYNLRKELNMLWPILIILLILWYLGLLTGCTMGGVIHVPMVIAIIILVDRIILERKYASDLANCLRR